MASNGNQPQPQPRSDGDGDGLYDGWVKALDAMHQQVGMMAETARERALAAPRNERLDYWTALGIRFQQMDRMLATSRDLVETGRQRGYF